MKNILVFIFICSFLGVNAQKKHCKKRSKAKIKHTNIKTDTLDKSPSFTVSFISTGGGIDKKAFNTFKKSIEIHDSVFSTKLTYQIKTWGREGERDFYFPSQNSNNYNEFIKETEKAFSTNSRIRLKKNVPPKK